MALPTNNKNNKGGKNQKNNNQGSKFIVKPSASKPTGGASKKPTRTGGTRGS